jgi:ATP-binding cassette, subfamily B, bacterial
MNMNGGSRSGGRVSLGTTRAQVSVLIGNRRGLVAALVSCSIVAAFVEVAFLALVAQVATTVVGNGHVHSAIALHASVGTLILFGFIICLVKIALQIPLSLLPARIAADVQGTLRRRLFGAFTRASWTVQSADREGQMQELVSSQVMQATGGAMQATGLLTSGITFLIFMLSAIALNVIAAVMVFVVGLVAFVVMRPLRGLGHQRAAELSAAQVRYAGVIAEANRLAEDTNVFGVAEAQRTRIGGFITTSQGLFYRTQVILKLAPNVYQSVLYLLLIALLAAIHFLAKGQAGSLGAIVLLLLRASQVGLSVQTSYQALTQSLPFIERTELAERRYLESMPSDGVLPLESIGSLALEDVSFAYREGQPVLSGISFAVSGREAIGVIGPSGAGKSTLIQILLHLREPDSGRYLVNEVPVGQFERKDWHRRVSFVPQEPRLIHASVSDNIRFFRDSDDEAVERAARLARIHDDIMGWPDRYETIVGPRADAVSGGQQQRICLARALVARPEVLILDEPTSALDPLSETLIQESLTGLRSELMLFIIAHRMSTLEICDRVMVILDGRLEAFDTKVALEEHNAYYRSASVGASRGPAE